MKNSPPYSIINLASEEIPIAGPDGQRITECLIPSRLSREEAVGKFYRGCPGPSLLPIFYNCLHNIAWPLMPNGPATKKVGVYPGEDDAMVEWSVECAQLAAELVHGKPSHCLYFPGTHFGDALTALIDAAKHGRPIVMWGFDFLSALKSVEAHRNAMQERSLPFSVAPDLYQQEDPSPDAFAHHLLQLIEIADGDREELTLQTKKGEISITREEVRPGFFVAIAYVPGESAK